jgi:hypothetical protein
MRSCRKRSILGTARDRISTFLDAAAVFISRQPILFAVVFVPAIVLAVLCVTGSWCYFRYHKEPIVIDASGVRIGDEWWTWERLKALRVFLGPNGYELLIWLNRDRGVGRTLGVDHPLDADAAQQLLTKLAAFISEHGLSVEVGAYKRGRR